MTLGSLSARAWRQSSYRSSAEVYNSNMAHICGECGSKLAADQSFCTMCGTAGAQRTVAADGAAKPTSRSWLIIVGVILTAVLVGGGSALALISARNNSDGSEPPVNVVTASAMPETSTVATPEQPTPSATTPGPTTPTATPPAPTSPAVPTFATMTGRWIGTMSGTDHYYQFRMDLRESGAGQLDGQIQYTQYGNQSGTATGKQAVEYLTGARSGLAVTLRGTSFAPGAPATWQLDTMTLTLGESGTTFEGTYTCDGCPVERISGQRDSGG